LLDDDICRENFEHEVEVVLELFEKTPIHRNNDEMVEQVKIILLLFELEYELLDGFLVEAEDVDECELEIIEYD